MFIVIINTPLVYRVSVGLSFYKICSIFTCLISGCAAAAIIAHGMWFTYKRCPPSPPPPYLLHTNSAMWHAATYTHTHTQPSMCVYKHFYEHNNII